MLYCHVIAEEARYDLVLFVLTVKLVQTTIHVFQTWIVQITIYIMNKTVTELCQLCPLFIIFIFIEAEWSVMPVNKLFK